MYRSKREIYIYRDCVFIKNWCFVSYFKAGPMYNTMCFCITTDAYLRRAYESRPLTYEAMVLSSHICFKLYYHVFARAMLCSCVVFSEYHFERPYALIGLFLICPIAVKPSMQGADPLRSKNWKPVATLQAMLESDVWLSIRVWGGFVFNSVCLVDW